MFSKGQAHETNLCKLYWSIKQISRCLLRYSLKHISDAHSSHWPEKCLFFCKQIYLESARRRFSFKCNSLVHTLTLEDRICLRVWFFFFILASWSNQIYCLHLWTFPFLCHSDYHSCNSHNCFSLCHYERVRRPSKSLNFAFPSWLFICHPACESIQGRIYPAC